MIKCTLGGRGAKFDGPNDRRAYTYTEQPCDSVLAWRLGAACSSAMADKAGDHIDRGLSLLKALQQNGFGVFTLIEGD